MSLKVIYIYIYSRKKQESSEFTNPLLHNKSLICSNHSFLKLLKSKTDLKLFLVSSVSEPTARDLSTSKLSLQTVSTKRQLSWSSVRYDEIKIN